MGNLNGYEVVNIVDVDDTNILNNILCIDGNLLEKKNTVQKDLKIEDVMSTCMYCPTDLSSRPQKCDGYVPLDFGVTVRDLHSNKVLFKEDEDIKRTFIYLTNVRPLMHRGYDLVMFMSAWAVRQVSDEECVKSQEYSSCMMGSAFDVNGLLWLEKNEVKDCILLNPMVMTTILVDADKFSKFLKPEWSFIELDDIEKKDGQIQCILDDIVKVDFKGGK